MTNNDNPNGSPAEFDTDSFLPAVSDDKGHNIHVSFRCQPDWGRHLKLIMKANLFPYVSDSDIIRHALLRHFQWLQGVQKDEIPNSLIGQILMAQSLLEDDRRQEAFRGLLETLQARVNAHVVAGNMGQARKHVLSTLRCIEDMPEGFWKDTFRDKVRGDYKELIKEAPRAKLSLVEEEEG